jgi:hypothetical protein
MANRLDYWRADNMWAAAGRPDGNLGQESITLEPGQTRVFVTDWKYEKQRNDGTNYYGSHGRRLTNSSSQPIDVRLTDTANLARELFLAVTGKPGYIRLKPGQTLNIKADIQEVTVPKV